MQLAKMYFSNKSLRPAQGRTEISLLAFTMCGTPEFMAPEFCMSIGYDHGADWWAFGCVLFEMYMGRNPFDSGGNLKQTFKEVCMIGMGKGKLSLHPKVNGSKKLCRELERRVVGPFSNPIDVLSHSTSLRSSQFEERFAAAANILHQVSAGNDIPCIRIFLIFFLSLRFPLRGNSALLPRPNG